MSGDTQIGFGGIRGEGDGGVCFSMVYTAVHALVHVVGAARTCLGGGMKHL